MLSSLSLVCQPICFSPLLLAMLHLSFNSIRRIHIVRFFVSSFLLDSRYRIAVSAAHSHLHPKSELQVITQIQCRSRDAPAGGILCYKDSKTYTRSGNIFGYAFLPDIFCRIFLGYIIYDLSNLSIFFKTLRYRALNNIQVPFLVSQQSYQE